MLTLCHQHCSSLIIITKCLLIHVLIFITTGVFSLLLTDNSCRRSLFNTLYRVWNISLAAGCSVIRYSLSSESVLVAFFTVCDIALATLLSFCFASMRRLLVASLSAAQRTIICPQAEIQEAAGKLTLSGKTRFLRWHFNFLNSSTSTICLAKNYRFLEFKRSLNFHRKKIYI